MTYLSCPFAECAALWGTRNDNPSSSSSNPCHQPLACRSHWRSRPDDTSPFLQKTAHQIMILYRTVQLFHFQTESRTRTKGAGVPVDHFAKLDTGNILTAQGDCPEKMARHERHPFLQRGRR